MSGAAKTSNKNKGKDPGLGFPVSDQLREHILDRMKDEKITIAEMSRRIGCYRTTLDRLLKPKADGVTIKASQDIRKVCEILDINLPDEETMNNWIWALVDLYNHARDEVSAALHVIRKFADAEASKVLRETRKRDAEKLENKRNPHN